MKQKAKWKDILMLQAVFLITVFTVLLLNLRLTKKLLA